MVYVPAYKTARKPLVESKFQNATGWPNADSQKASIFEAIGIVGRAKFGPDWDESELAALDWPKDPREAYEHSLRPAPINGGGGAPGGGRGSQPIVANPNSEWISKSPEAHIWAYRKELSVKAEEAAWRHNNLARDRLFFAIDWLAQRCRDGELVTYARLVTGGGLHPMNPSEWNVESPLNKFVCGGSFQRYFREYNRTYPAYVFLDRAEIEKAVAVLANAPTVIADLDLQLLSPYLRLAVKLALAKGYTSNGSPDTQAVREAES